MISNKDLGILEKNKIYLGDCFNLLPKIESNSIDHIIIDPPYGKGFTAWDLSLSSQDISILCKEFNRILTSNSFLCFFGLLPTALNWIETFNNFFKYRLHIIWVKRHLNPLGKVFRQFENIFIYAKGEPKYNNTKDRCSDILTGFTQNELGSLQYLYKKLRYYEKQIIEFEKGNGKQLENRGGKSEKIKFIKGNNLRWRASPIQNFSDVWSFKTCSHEGENFNPHETGKSILLLDRLVKLISKENEIILDCFAGSGTTLLSCKRTNRQFIGIEKEPVYYELCLKRLKEPEKRKENLLL